MKVFFFYFNWSTVAKSSYIEYDICYPKYFCPLITILQSELHYHFSVFSKSLNNLKFFIVLKTCWRLRSDGAISTTGSWLEDKNTSNNIYRIYKTEILRLEQVMGPQKKDVCYLHATYVIRYSFAFRSRIRSQNCFIAF